MSAILANLERENPTDQIRSPSNAGRFFVDCAIVAGSRDGLLLFRFGQVDTLHATPLDSTDAPAALLSTSGLQTCAECISFSWLLMVVQRRPWGDSMPTRTHG